MGIQTFTQVKNGNGGEGLLPLPNSDAQRCLVEHHSTIHAYGLCATPTWLPAGIPITEIAGDITVHRDIFGVELYADDTQGDAIVTKDSSLGYLPSSGTGAPPTGTSTPTKKVDQCDVTFGQLMSNPLTSTLNAFADGVLIAVDLGVTPLAAPIQKDLAAVALVADCSHTNITNPAADPAATIDVINAINATVSDDITARTTCPTSDVLREASAQYGHSGPVSGIKCDGPYAVGTYTDLIVPVQAIFLLNAGKWEAQYVNHLCSDRTSIPADVWTWACAVPAPGCPSAGTLLGALSPAHQADGITDIKRIRCEDSFAVAAGETPTYAEVLLFRYDSTQRWEEVDTAEMCGKGSVPESLMQEACHSG
ncbi:hypothetical protein [Nakamurella sp. PAMC28650]|uniref:hypothetical protein n=1 Tax=Nakamurella sp. PAMC28650 TaxID=2762325 RepID=UPI002106A56C|nr:hypothetical protein [Nakamurella sp. PAMC28650]